jgi:hypothetical protein
VSIPLRNCDYDGNDSRSNTDDDDDDDFDDNVLYSLFSCDHDDYP